MSIQTRVRNCPLWKFLAWCSGAFSDCPCSPCCFGRFVRSEGKLNIHELIRPKSFNFKLRLQPLIISFRLYLEYSINILYHHFAFNFDIISIFHKRWSIPICNGFLRVSFHQFTIFIGAPFKSRIAILGCPPT